MSCSLVEQKIRELQDAVNMGSDEPIEVLMGREDYFNLWGHIRTVYGGAIVVGDARHGGIQIAGATIRMKSESQS